MLELFVDGTFTMDTVDTSTETLLATEALARHPAPRRVLVGGLGLGFTVRAVLADPRVEHVDVVERAEPLVRWAREAVVPELEGLEGERCTFTVDDVRAVVTGTRTPVGPWDVVLLDVDNGPGFLVHPDNAELYRAPMLLAARDALRDGGLLAVWSSHVAPDLLARLGDVAGPDDVVDEHVLDVEREGRSFTYAVYSLVRDAAGRTG